MGKAAFAAPKRGLVTVVSQGDKAPGKEEWGRRFLKLHILV